MQSQESECLTVSVEDAARILGIGRQLAYEMVKQGKIPALRFGQRCIRVPKVALENMANGGGTQVEVSRGE